MDPKWSFRPLGDRGRCAVAARSLSSLLVREAANGGARDRHRGVRQGSAVEGSTGHGDARSGEDRSKEVRVREGRGLGDVPIHIGRLPAAARDHREAGASECARPEGPDLEDPDPVRGTVERQHAASLRRRGVEAIDSG